MDLINFMTSENDKKMLLAGLARVIYADGIVSDSEKDFFNKLSMGLNLQNVQIEILKNQTISFSRSSFSMFFLTQAVQLCYVDGSYDVAERNELLKICKEMDISENALIEVEKWVEEGIEWNNRGMELLNLR